MIPLVKKLHPQGIPWPASLLYNRLSRTRIFREHYRRVADHVAALPSLAPDTRILDIGTGPGFLLHELAARLPRARITGLDISPAMTDQARKNLGRAGLDGKIALCAGDAAGLPFKDAAFGCLVSTGALHHWKNPGAALAELHRVLVPGGLALVCDLVRHLPPELRQTMRKEFGRFRLALLWLHSFEEPFMTPGEMKDLAAASPFRVPEPRFTGGLCCLALEKPQAEG